MDPANITPIASLNPFNTNAVIKARLSSKGAIIAYSNAKGPGKRLAVNFVDATGEIGCTMFNEIVDQFDPILEVGKLYIISKASIKAGNPKFTKNDFEMSLWKTSQVVACDAEEGDEEIPSIRYTLLDSIDQITEIPVGEIVDVVAAVHRVGNLESITTKKDGRELSKRTLELIDKSKRIIEFTLWGEHADNFAGSVGSVVTIKGARIGEFRNARTLGSHSLMEVDPPYDCVQALAEWYRENQAELGSVANLSAPARGSSGPTPDGTFEDLQARCDEASANGDSKPQYCRIRGTVTRVLHDERAPLYYLAAPDSARKVVENTNGNGKAWYCSGNDTYYDTCEPRYVLSVVVADSTKCEFVSVFDDVGRTLIRAPASEAKALKDASDIQGLDILFANPIHQRYVFELKANEETRGDETKLRFTAVSAEPINFASESQRLINEIHQLK